MKRIAFIMEIGLGHTTYYKNLQATIAGAGDIAPTWIPITFEKKGLLAHLPKVRNEIVFRAGVQAYGKLRAASRQNRFDALFFHTQMPAVFCQGFMRQTPSVIDIDATPRQFLELGAYYGLKIDAQSAQERRREQWYQRAFRAAHTVFTWSRWAAKSAIEDYGAVPERTHVLPPGIDTCLWKPDPMKRPNDGVTRILFTGGDFERKGGDLLLRWAQETAKKNWELHLVTQGRIDSPPPGVHVHNSFASNASGLIELAQKCDIFALPTRADCSPIASLEAMAAGLPVVITDVGGISEGVREGETGYLVPVNDYEAFRARLDHLIATPAQREAMGNRGREVVCTEFQVGDRLVERLREVASAKMERYVR